MEGSGVLLDNVPPSPCLTPVEVPDSLRVTLTVLIDCDFVK